MGVPTNANISASNNINLPFLTENTNESNLNNPLQPVSSNPQTAAATAQDVESLDKFSNNQENLPENLWVKEAKDIQIITITSAIILPLLSVKGICEGTYFGLAFFLVSGVSLILFSVFGNRRRDWRLILGVSLTATAVSVYFAVNCVLTTSDDFWNLPDAQLAMLGVSKRKFAAALHIAFVAFTMIFSMYWVLIAYLNFKIVYLARAEATRIRQPASSNEARGDASVIGDLTRAGTFANVA